MLGLGLGLNQRSGGGGFSPASLFANGEDGVWLEPGVGALQGVNDELSESDTADPVGFQLSRANGAGFSGGAFTGLNSTEITNGSFDANSDWLDMDNMSSTISGGQIEFSTTSNNRGPYQQLTINDIGSFYL